MTCDICDALATHSVTDAVQTECGWTETLEQRFGCNSHRVEPKVHLLNGSTMTVRDYATQ